MRDPTRGGVATSLNELARDCGLGVVLFEDTIPVHAMQSVARANSWASTRFTSQMKDNFSQSSRPKSAEAALKALQQIPGGDEARIIGEDTRTTCRLRFG